MIRMSNTTYITMATGSKCASVSTRPSTSAKSAGQMCLQKSRSSTPTTQCADRKARKVRLQSRSPKLRTYGIGSAVLWISGVMKKRRHQLRTQSNKGAIKSTSRSFSNAKTKCWCTRPTQTRRRTSGTRSIRTRNFVRSWLDSARTSFLSLTNTAISNARTRTCLSTLFSSEQNLLGSRMTSTSCTKLCQSRSGRCSRKSMSTPPSSTARRRKSTSKSTANTAPTWTCSSRQRRPKISSMCTPTRTKTSVCSLSKCWLSSRLTSPSSPSCRSSWQTKVYSITFQRRRRYVRHFITFVCLWITMTMEKPRS